MFQGSMSEEVGGPMYSCYRPRKPVSKGMCGCRGLKIMRNRWPWSFSLALGMHLAAATAPLACEQPPNSVD